MLLFRAIERKALAQERRVVPETIARFIKDSAPLVPLTLKQMHMYQTMRDLEDECWRIVDEGAGTVEAVWSEVIKVHPWAALDSVRAVLDRERPGRLDDR